MADVRLTATNPDDSTVVPVACNAKGELKLEEFPDQSFDGNLDGNLTVSGSGTFEQRVSVGGDPGVGARGVNVNPVGYVGVCGGHEVGNYVFSGSPAGTSVPTSQIFSNGAAAFGNSFGDINFTIGDEQSAVTITGRDVANSSTEYAFLAQHYLDGARGDLFRVNYDGSSLFAGGKCTIGNQGDISIGSSMTNYGDVGVNVSSNGSILACRAGVTPVWTATQGVGSAATSRIYSDGQAFFNNDVVVGSRGSQWMIVESGGLAHLVEQTAFKEISTADLVDPGSVSTADLVNPETNYPPLRDIPGELTMVEQQLQKVMERLKMAPEAGWEVWDGSD